VHPELRVASWVTVVGLPHRLPEVAVRAVGSNSRFAWEGPNRRATFTIGKRAVWTHDERFARQLLTPELITAMDRELVGAWRVEENSLVAWDWDTDGLEAPGDGVPELESRIMRMRPVIDALTAIRYPSPSPRPGLKPLATFAAVGNPPDWLVRKRSC
jgi:hypothetical protein